MSDYGLCPDCGASLAEAKDSNGVYRAFCPHEDKFKPEEDEHNS